MIVCEVGLNHLGNEDYSLTYVDFLSKTKCDAITYQIREDEFYQRDKYKNYNLSFDHYAELAKATNKKFGLSLAEPKLLTSCESVDPDFYKVLSWHLSNYSYIDRLLSETEKSIYVSTGTSSIDQLDDFYKRYGENRRINFIHTQLTKDPKDANLKSIKFLKDRYPYEIGFGNHSENSSVILGSVVFEPSSLWFYVRGATYNWRFHPDEFWAIPLDDVDSLIDDIQIVKSSLGNETKTSTNTKGY